MDEGNYSTFVKQNIELDYIFNVIHYYLVYLLATVTLIFISVIFLSF